MRQFLPLCLYKSLAILKGLRTDSSIVGCIKQFSYLIILYALQTSAAQAASFLSVSPGNSTDGRFILDWGEPLDFDSALHSIQSVKLTITHNGVVSSVLSQPTNYSGTIFEAGLDGDYSFNVEVCGSFNGPAGGCFNSTTARATMGTGTVSYPITNTPPQVVFTAGIESSYEPGENVTIEVVATDITTDDIPNASSTIKNVKLYLTESSLGFSNSGNLLANLSSSNGGVYTHNFTANQPGQYYLIAIAEDTLDASSYAVQAITVMGDTDDFNFPSTTQSEPVSFKDYQAYFGDFNGDGFRDLYFHGLRQIILLHGDIVTPIVLPAKEGFILFGKPDGSFDEVESWAMDDDSMVDCKADGTCVKVSDEKIIYGDFDGDGLNDVFVKSPDSFGSSALISGSIGDSPPLLIAQIFSSGQVSVAGQIASDLPLFANNLSDVSISITVQNLIVNGISYSAQNLVEGTSSEGASIAPNENISELKTTGALPQTSLTSSDVVALDALVGVGGEFRVNEMGAATYNIPLKLPAGAAGVAPSLGMSYSSQGQSGNMGLGWQFSSVGQITRCSQTLQIDKKAMPITFSKEDRFCINGQRLLVLGGVEYGSVGAEYKPEIDSGVVIISHEGKLGHPGYFSVTAKDGSTSIFGDDNNSLRRGYNEAGSPVNDHVMSWHLSEFRDSVGNKITYHYSDTSNYFRLDEVRYAYDINGSSPKVYIYLDYGSRKTSRPTWVSGVVFKDNSLLNAVRIEDNGVAVNQYKIEYNQNVYYAGEDTKDRVTEIYYCANESYCSQPLTFKWGHSHALSFGINSTNILSTYSKNALQSSDRVSELSLTAGDDDNYYAGHVDLDINGDGLLDMAVLTVNHTNYRKYSLHEYHQERDGLLTKFVFKRLIKQMSGDPSARLGAETPTMQVVDVNADGRSDLALYVPETGLWDVLQSKPSATLGWYLTGGLGVSDQTFPKDMPDNVRFADLNSDGLVDLFYSKDNKFIVRYLMRVPGSGKYSYLEKDPLEVSAQSFDTFNFGGVVDFNQDGKIDILAANIDTEELVGDYSGSFPSPRPRNRTCEYNISFDFLMSSENGFSQVNSIPFRSGSHVVTEVAGGRHGTGSEYVIAYCTNEEFRRRVIGPYLADINGDGVKDISMAFAEPQETTDSDAGSKKDPEYRFQNIYYRLGNPEYVFGDGSPMFDEEIPVSFDGDAVGFQMLDTNSDGNQDLIVIFEDDERRAITWNEADSKFRDDTYSLITAKNEDAQTRYGDLNNDGLIDRVHINTDTKSMFVHWGAARSNDVIYEIENRVGQKTLIQHRPLNLSNAYTKLGGISTITAPEPHCVDYEDEYYDDDYYDELTEEEEQSLCIEWAHRTYANAEDFYDEINNPFANEDPASSLAADASVPAQEYISGMPVVTMVGSSAPTTESQDSLAKISYRYESLKIQAGGRGMLGFKSLMSTDLQTGVSTTTEYRQDWPFIGAPKSTTVKTMHGQILTQSTTMQGLFGISESNIGAKRSQIAEQGTGSLGSLVVYTKENKELVYDVDPGQLKMPEEPPSGSPTTNILKEVVLTTAVDSWNNILNTESLTYSYSGSSKTKVEEKTTTNTYYPGEGERLGRLARSVVYTDRPGAGGTDEITRTADFTYYGYPGAQCSSSSSSLNGLLCSEKITVSGLDSRSQPPVETLHYYDDFGNKAFQQNGSRVSPLTMYESGRYPSATYDVFSQSSGELDGSPILIYAAPTGSVVLKVSEVIVRNHLGIPLLSRAYIGNQRSVVSSQAASPMGIVYFKGDSTGNFEQTQRRILSAGENTNCPSSAVTLQTVTKAGGSQGHTCIDKVGREVGSYTYNLAGQIIRTETRYDILGRANAVSIPTIGTPSFFSQTNYDILGRPIDTIHTQYITNDDGEETDDRVKTYIDYDGFAITTTTSGVSGGSDRVRLEVKDALGQLVSVTEQNERSVDYVYDLLGNLEEMTDPLGYKSNIEYNALGQKIGMSDPDKGDWTYYYNSFGELYKQIDAKSQITLIDYDFKGRKTSSRTYAAGVNTASGIPSIHQQWIYDSATNGLGQIASESDLSQQHTQQYEYDDQGRVAYTATSMPNHLGEQERFYQKQTYDQYGRAYQTFDGARVGPQFSYNGIQNVYNSYGFLVEVRDAANDGDYFYKMLAADARGNVTHMQYGDGSSLYYNYNVLSGALEVIGRSGFTSNSLVYEATWDHLGNLVARKDGLYGSKVETFAYDKYNRLTSNTLDNKTVEVTYNLIDNITSKSDQSAGATYQYHPSKVHAVEKVGTRELEYDANGNATKDGNKTLFYSVKDQVTEIVTSSHTSEFSYGVGGGRFKRMDTNNDGDQTTTLYLGSVEKVYNADGSIQWKRAIGGKAQVIYTQAANGSLGTGVREYFLHDHLGSIVAIANSNGDIVQRMAYDPWGARRKMTNNQWQAASMDPFSGLVGFYKANKPKTNRGFTSHEMLDEVGIIHMNGRIYDSSLGRFLQADPHIQSPTAVGSLNRYSYVMNNPLNATDPTGYFFKKLLAVVAIAVVTYFTAGAASGWAMSAYGSTCAVTCSAATASLVGSIAGGAAAGFVGGALGTLAAGGDINQAFKNGLIGAVSGAAFGAIGANFTKTGGFLKRGGLGHISAHGLVGGISNVLQGGKFGHGFFSAGVAKFSGAHMLSGIEGDSMGAILGRSTLAGIVGGTVSEATGGKFANGARTAALAHLVNQEGRRALASRRDGAGRGYRRNQVKLSQEEQLKRLATVGVIAAGALACPVTGCSSLGGAIAITTTAIGLDQFSTMTGGESLIATGLTVTFDDLSHEDALFIRDTASVGLSVFHPASRGKEIFQSITTTGTINITTKNIIADRVWAVTTATAAGTITVDYEEN